MDSKMICEKEIENVNFKLMSNDDEKQYQQLYVEHMKRNDIILVAPCDYFTAVSAVMFSETLEEVKERLSTTWSEYALKEYINFITNGDD